MLAVRPHHIAHRASSYRQLKSCIDCAVQMLGETYMYIATPGLPLDLPLVLSDSRIDYLCIEQAYKTSDYLK